MVDKSLNYRKYARGEKLLYSFQHQTALFFWMIDHIRQSIEDEFVLDLDSWPRHWKGENEQHIAEREEMISYWTEDKEVQDDVWDTWTKKARDDFLTELFYSILRQDHPEPSEAGMKSSKPPELQALDSVTVSEPFGSVDVTSLLVDAVPKVREIHSRRYGQFIDSSPNLARDIEGLIRPQVLELLRKPRITRDDLLALGGDLKRKGPAIYLHILWHPDMLDYEFFPYIGQAIVFCDRHSSHVNPCFRITHPSLHYHVWDSRDDVQEAFVLVATPEIEDLDKAGLMLNLLEFCSCILFQSLDAREMNKFVSTKIFQPGHNLNVANPLWQGAKSVGLTEEGSYEKKAHFSTLIRNADPVSKEYYLSLAQAYRDLKDSPNPALRQYYLASHQRAQQASSMARTDSMISDLMSGVEKEVSFSARAQVISFSYVRFIISKELVRLREGTKVHVQGYLTSGVNPNRYCMSATEIDPASRLSIRVVGHDGKDRPFSIFISGNGESIVRNVNTMIDTWEGKSNDEIAEQANRRIPRDASKGRGAYQYS